MNTEGTIYIQEDFGDISLLNRLEETGHTAEIFDLFKKSLKELAHLQIQGDEGLDYEDWCLTSSEFGKQAIMSDLLYFKYYFLDTLQLPYDKEKLIADFETFSSSARQCSAINILCSAIFKAGILWSKMKLFISSITREE